MPLPTCEWGRGTVAFLCPFREGSVGWQFAGTLSLFAGTPSSSYTSLAPLALRAAQPRPRADTSGTRLRIETTIERMGSIISTARCIVSL